MLIRLLAHVHRQLLYLIFWFLLSFLVSLSEFLGNCRNLCITMPWIIRPALVVLWGVCWKFYGPPYDYGDLSHHPSLVPSQASPSFRESESSNIFSAR